jgi:flagellar hook protein FlgE
MSLNSAMLAGVSGLSANSSAMAVISDNIANVNTTAFKRNRTDFTRLVNAQTRSTAYSAGGVDASTRQFVRNEGSVNQSSSPTDLAISGQGFFVVSPSSQIDANNPEVLFSRVGTFNPDDEGYLVNHANYFLRGIRLDENGVPLANTASVNNLEAVNIKSITNAASPSSVVSIIGNLRSNTSVSAAATAAATGAAGAYNAATNNMASGAITSDASWQFQLIDSLGSVKNFTMSFLKSATPNQWSVEIYATPASNVTTGAPLVNGQIMTGTLAFTPTGSIDSTATTPALLAPISIGAYTAGAPAAGAINWANATGLAAQTFSLDIGQNATGTGAISQFSADTAITSTSSDGVTTGELSNIEIDEEGFVTAIFSSGLSRKVFQIPLVTFVNPDDLDPVIGGNYRQTSDSGSASLKSAGTGGAGTIKSGALEASTVDLANEFANMIITQRAYSASSKIITTADEMLDELIRMKR